MVYANWVIFMKKVFTIVEEVMHNVVRLSINKSAFTLAEVLVTLGIIGVVAAMTLPMLAKNYQFYVRQQQFKKVYAAMSIAAQKTQIDLGEGVRCHYSYKTNDIDNYSYSAADCNFFFSELAKNLQIIKHCERKPYEGLCLPKDLKGGDIIYAESQGGEDKEAAKEYFSGYCTAFTSGHMQSINAVYLVNSGFYFMPFHWSTKKHIPLFLVDVNGHKGPNKWGHDVFIFEFYKAHKNDSVFKINASKRCHPIEEGGYYTTHFMEYLYGRSTDL